MTSRHTATIALLIALSIAHAEPALAQDAGLAITVLRASDRTPIAGATIDVANPAIGFSQRERTDVSGQARIAGLPTSGEYIVSVEAGESHASIRSQPMSLRSRSVRAVTLLAPTHVTTVVVEGQRVVSQLNAVNAEVSATLDADDLERLPIEGRDVMRALVRLPNVVPSTGFFPEAPAISINGSNGLYVSYLVDGLDNNENFLGGQKFPVPLGAARDVTVLANNFSAEFGRSATGVVNVTSRAGGNAFESELYTLVRPGHPPDSSSAYPQRDLSGNAVGESFERWQAGASLGGPIVRDRSFFFTNVEYTRDSNETLLDAPAVGAVDSLEGNNHSLLASLRLDHRFDDRWTGTLRGNVGRVTIERPGGALGGGNVQFPSAGSEQDRDALLLTATLRYEGDVWSYRSSLQTSGFDWDYGEPRQAGPQVTALDESRTAPVAVVGHPGFVFDERERTYQVLQKAERALGSHRLSFGADYLSAQFDLNGGGNPDGNFVVVLTDEQLAALRARGLGAGLTADDILAVNPQVSSYGVELRPAAFGRTQRLAALYVEDEWHIGPRLTLTAGLRWDYDSLTGEGSGDDDLDNFAPRLSVNFRPDERNVLRAGAGIFYEKLTYAVVSDALQRNTTSASFRSQLASLIALGALPPGTDLDRVTFDGNLTVSPGCTTVAACPPASAVQGMRDTETINEARILNPVGYESPSAVQLSLGWQRQISDRWSGALDLLYNRARHLVRLRDLNAPPPFTPNAAVLTPATIARLRALPDNDFRIDEAVRLGLVRTPGQADLLRPVGVLPGGARQITVSETEGNAEYRALNLQLERRLAGHWGGRLSYTLSNLENDTDDINFRASNSNDFASDRGPSANDRRHVISAVLYLLPRPDLTLTAAGLFQSGQPVNLVPDARTFGTQDLNGDGASFGESFVGNSDRYPGESRNSRRLPWSKTLDLGARYRFRLGGFELTASADVFNVFDSNNTSGFANAATTSNQVQFGGGAPFVQRNAGPPRQFQFGLAARM